MTAHGSSGPDEGDWKETVRDIYDTLHFGQGNVFTKNNRLASRLVDMIEERHPGFFRPEHPVPPPPEAAP
jgi:hypothetical protein